MLLSASLAGMSSAYAEDSYPSKAIHISVAYPAGGLSDTVARRLADKASETLKVPVVVENKPGAGGTVNMAALAKEKPDGYSLGFSSTSPLTLNPFLAKVNYDPKTAVTPVIGIMYSPVILLGTAVLDANDFKSFTETAKQKPNSIRWATSGMGTIGHIMFEQVASAYKLDMTLVPYKGGSQQLNDALGNQFEVFSTNVSPVLIENIAAGKLKALAIGAEKRLDSLPDTPTFNELNQPKSNLKSNFGIFAPAGTPEPIIAKLNTVFNEVLAEKDFQQSLIDSGNIPTGGSAMDFQKIIDAEFNDNEAIIKETGMDKK